MRDDTSIGGGRREFPETRWSRIVGARESAEARRVALEELLAAYWKPLYFHARRKGTSIEAAKDAVQGFCLKLLASDEFLARLDPAKGRFRSYLRAAFDNFRAHAHERDTAEKRGGGARVVSLDVEGAERDLAAAPASPDDAFEREWARGVMDRAIGRLRRELEAGKWRGPFDVALRFFGVEAPPSYADAAAACGKTVPQLKMFVHRARTRFREIVREEVAETVADAAEVDAEIDALLRALAR